MNRFALACPVLVALVPLVAGHVSNFSDAQSILVGPYVVFVDPQPIPLFAGENATIEPSVLREGRAVDVSLELAVTDSAGASIPTHPATSASGQPATGFRWGSAGNHTLAATIEDANGTHRGNATFHVFPNLPIRVRASDATMDPRVGQPVVVAVDVVDARTGEASASVADLRLRAEHWTDDHKQLLSAEHHAMQPATVGRWQVELVFPWTGMAHLRFASDSGNFAFQDVPMLHTYVGTPDGDAESPSASMAVFLLALAAGAALRRRK